MMAPSGSSNQTISYLMRRFAEVGLHPHSRHGQNFLIDLNLQRLIVDAAQLTPDDLVLEIGTGTGALTALIAARARAVVSVEIDAHLHQLASEELFGLPNVVLLQQDALRNKNNIHPRIFEVLREQLGAHPHTTLKLVANLPFNIATPILSNLLASPLVPASMTITIQKELADRIVARPSTKDYGALSVWIQSQCRIETVRTLPPTVFWPRPKVTSVVLHIELDESLRARIVDRPFFHQSVRSLFFHRRKFLRSVLRSAYKERLDKMVIDEVLLDQALGPETRAEQLDVETIIRLCDALRARLPDVECAPGPSTAET